MSKGLLLALGAIGIGYMLVSSSSSGSTGGSSGEPGTGGSSGCPGNLPKATGSTDFDGMPDDFRDVYEGPIKLTPDDVAPINQEAAALGALTLASQARCAGYTTAAKKLEDKAAVIRSWKLG